MKIVTKVGNLMNITSGHIVHGCNAHGVMGSGVALAVKRKYPEAYDDYTNIYQTAGLTLGRAYPVYINDGLVIWNAITQDSFGPGVRRTSYDAVETCFSQVNAHIGELPNTPREIHIPLIGAARGGGNWEIIREIIEQTVSYPVTLWLPDSTVDTK